MTGASGRAFRLASASRGPSPDPGAVGGVPGEAQSGHVYFFYPGEAWHPLCYFNAFPPPPLPNCLKSQLILPSALGAETQSRPPRPQGSCRCHCLGRGHHHGISLPTLCRCWGHGSQRPLSNRCLTAQGRERIPHCHTKTPGHSAQTRGLCEPEGTAGVRLSRGGEATARVTAGKSRGKTGLLIPRPLNPTFPSPGEERGGQFWSSSRKWTLTGRVARRGIP